MNAVNVFLPQFNAIFASSDSFPNNNSTYDYASGSHCHNTRTTITAAIDPPSPGLGLSAAVLWLCCAVVVSVVLDVVTELDGVTGIIVVGGMVVEY